MFMKIILFYREENSKVTLCRLNKGQDSWS